MLLELLHISAVRTYKAQCCRYQQVQWARQETRWRDTIASLLKNKTKTKQTECFPEKKKRKKKDPTPYLATNGCVLLSQPLEPHFLEISYYSKFSRHPTYNLEKIICKNPDPSQQWPNSTTALFTYSVWEQQTLKNKSLVLSLVQQ